MSGTDDIPRVRPLRQQVVSAQDQALLDAGRSLLTSSATVGRDFAKAMTPASTAAIAVYFAVLKAVAPNKTEFSVWEGLVIIVPALVFVLASACFILAFTPRLKRVSLNAIADLGAALDAIVVRQHRWNRNGLWLFALATALAGIGLTLAMLRWQLPTDTR
jgi:hypothetical protein